MQQPHSYTRRAFIQTLLAAPLAFGATALLPEEAEAKTQTLDYITVPQLSSWKKIKRKSMMVGNSQKRYWYSFNWKTKSGASMLCYVMELYLSMPKRKEGSEKPQVTYLGTTHGNESLKWRVEMASNIIDVEMVNIPYEVWFDQRRQKPQHRMSVEQAKMLLKASTGGKIKYSKLMKWSKAKAKKQGVKAVKAWVGSKIVKKIRMQ